MPKSVLQFHIRPPLGRIFNPSDSHCRCPDRAELCQINAERGSVFQALTRPRMCYQPSNDPQRAISSINLRFSMKSRGCLRRLDGAEPGQSNDTRCSGTKIVNKRRVVNPAPPSSTQTRNLPHSQRTSHSKVRISTLYGPATAVSSTQPRFPVNPRNRNLPGPSVAVSSSIQRIHEDSCGLHLVDDARLFQNEENEVLERKRSGNDGQCPWHCPLQPR